MWSEADCCVEKIDTCGGMCDFEFDGWVERVEVVNEFVKRVLPMSP